MTGRWGMPREQLAAGSRLESMPAQFGTWRLQSSEQISDDVRNTLQCTGQLLRSYFNEKTGETVRVTVLLGPSGPISVHTPEICYSSQNHEIVEQRRRVPVHDSRGANHEFWAVGFQSKDLEARRLSVYYGWTTDGRWSAPKQPRFSFATSPHLYKIQLAAYPRAGAGSVTDGPCIPFLQDFVPLVNDCMVSPSTKGL